ncbi:AAA domain-containing protein [Ensifer sp. ENS12]|uniref:AAA domain-containing protein n=1 Tax=Ensifer sp. ENS12 TaxID=2854774 RepID=UPI001C44E676|nr:AAA domain-containing protein [Ensifer sp. ENS12]MBV7519078.1 DUF4011 domain-containing protein [Ensifer sp. ENS12]
MIRFCPNCETERPLSEFYCQGTLPDGSTCNWDLSSEAIRSAGSSSEQAAVTSEASQPSADNRCPNGHPTHQGDLICLVCGAEIADGEDGSAEAIHDEPVTTDLPTQIAGWSVQSRIPSSSTIKERFLVVHATTAQRGILTLYSGGSEPDTAVYDALRNLPLDHLPEIIEVGRWHDRAYEIGEEITGGTLAAFHFDGKNIEVLRRVVSEIGGALNSFTQVGLRHRDVRPGNILVRTETPLDLVITGFGSARLSDYDLDVVAPLETTRYMAPEAIAGGVAAASDWWSLGMIMLELATGGQCFKGVNEQAFLIHLLTTGVSIPDDLAPSIATLLKGLLARDHRARWQWPEVRGWLNGDEVPVPVENRPEVEVDSGKSIALGGKEYHRPSGYALAAAEPANWDEARTQVQRGAVAAWVEDAQLPSEMQSAIRNLGHAEGLSEDLRLAIALKILHPSMPLVVKGNLVTPGWLLDHPQEGTELVFGPATSLLARLGAEEWLQRLRQRGESVRGKAQHFDILLNEDELKIHLLSTSKARLAALWADRRRLFPDTEHPGLNSLIERRQTTEEDYILLLSADVGQFRSVSEILQEAELAAHRAGLTDFETSSAAELLDNSRRDLHRLVEARLAAFSRCDIARIDEWADQFRLDRRMPIERALVLLSIPEGRWKEPPKQAYVSTLLQYFSKKVSGGILRGPLTRMVIGKTTPRVDLTELGTERRPAPALLDHLLTRSDRSEDVDPAAFGESDTLERRLRSLHSHATLYKRDTGIDGMYLGFPFLLFRDDRGTKTKIAPILIWPVKVTPEVGNRGHVTIAFDRDRDEVRLNPAFESIMGIDASRRWQDAANDLLGRATLTAADVVDGFGSLAQPLGRALAKLPNRDAEVEFGRPAIAPSAVLFHLAYMGQAIVEDLRQLQGRQPSGSALETVLKVTEAPPVSPPLEPVRELLRYFTVASDPSQEAAVMEARHAPGLLIEGPPGTGKSQTIVNMVADAIGRKKSLLVICQKQAALEVVKKRLDAEGLDDRIFMVTDMNRDREPLLKAIRDQLQALAMQPSGGIPTWRRERENLALKIEAIEGDLDRHHQAVHEPDEHTGLTYRALLSDLIRLEEDGAPIDVPALRRILGSLDPGDVSGIEERCGPVARYWLPSKFEDSPLHVINVFSPDKATIAALHDDFSAFMRSEKERAAVLQRTEGALPISDPEPFRSWFERHDQDFRQMDDDERGELARWLAFCRPDASGTSKASKLVTEIQGLQVQLSGFDGEPPTAQHTAVALGLLDRELSHWVDLANTLTEPPSFIDRVNPLRWLKKRQLRSFLDEKVPADVDFARFLAAGLWEQRLRPIRTRLRELLKEINEEALVTPSLPARDLESIAGHRANALARVLDLAAAVVSFPIPGRMAEVALANSLAEYDRLKDSAFQAFERFEAVQFSRAALSNLEQWFRPDWVLERLRAIETGKANGAAIAQLLQHESTLADFQRFRLRLETLNARDLDIFRQLRAKEPALEHLAPDLLEAEIRRIIRREASLSWKARLEAANPKLLYEASELQAKIRTLSEAEVAMRRANRQLLIKGIDMSRVSPERQWEPITRLRGQRAQRMREFMEKAPDLGLMELRPVWLMNPDVASRILPLRNGLFDIVIYDEASQMPVEYALPTLYRGKLVIVSGDEKQMPPTAFFSSKVENDEADVFDGEELEEDASELEREIYNDTWNRREIKDCPDLLQLGKAVLPTTTLQIHYRSAYRELIGFSNASFYANRLSVPVRHPDEEVARARPIEVIRVDGVYKDQTNEAEARKVVDTLIEIWNRGGPTPTIGVVTFNRKQADLIEEVLDEVAESDEWFRSMLARESERIEAGEDVGFFVKNVENVQGDERDYIIFSSTFGRNSQGTFRRNFGVLGQKGGERRLNVAVTRARHKVIMVTSMPIGEISDMLSSRRLPSAPRDYLQGYLEYARLMSDGDFGTGRNLLNRLVTEKSTANAADEGEIDGFADSVADYLDVLGVTAHRANDGSAFGIDFAVEDPRTGLYGIGIECDAPRHRILEGARAREIWRPAVLRRAIPHIHRVSCHGWYHAPDEERSRLRSAIDRALYREAAE